jgi:hypothetical protein
MSIPKSTRSFQRYFWEKRLTCRGLYNYVAFFLLIALLITAWSLFTYKFRLVGDARAAAVKLDCIERTRSIGKRIVAIAKESSIHRNGDITRQLYEVELWEYLEKAGCAGKCSCTLSRKPNALGDGFILASNAIEAICRKSEVNNSPVSIVMCHDFDHLHRVNSMIFTILLLNDGKVISCQVDPIKYQSWIVNEFREGRHSLDLFEKHVGPVE